MGRSLGADFVPRLASAAVLAPLMVLVAWWGGWPFALVLLVASVLVLWEWVTMAALVPHWPLVALGTVALATATVAALLAPPASALLPLVLGALALGLAGRPHGWALAAPLYAGAALVPTVVLRGDAQLGAAAILWLFAVVWTTDVAAYLVGRLVGGPKLWARVSPGKTWSGAVGGTLGGCLAGLAVAALFGLPAGILLAFVSLAASVASQAGDLFESAMKRRFGVKDSSRLIPGHGGLMDRLDGFIAAAALALLVGWLRDPAAPAAGLLLW